MGSLTDFLRGLKREEWDRERLLAELRRAFSEPKRRDASPATLRRWRKAKLAATEGTKLAQLGEAQVLILHRRGVPRGRGRYAHSHHSRRWATDETLEGNP